MNPNIIGLYSPAMGSGKTELTNVLVNKFGYTCIKFAQTLKDMVRVLLRDMGVPEGELARYTDGDLKERELPIYGVSPRYMMQTLGTEWGRNTIFLDLWTTVTGAKVHKVLYAGGRVVIDDMRFPNEFEAMRSIDAVLVRVVRPGVQPINGHTSEGRLEHFHFDYNLVNADTLEAWHGLAEHFYEKITHGVTMAG